MRCTGSAAQERTLPPNSHSRIARRQPCRGYREGRGRAGDKMAPRLHAPAHREQDHPEAKVDRCGGGLRTRVPDQIQNAKTLCCQGDGGRGEN